MVKIAKIALINSEIEVINAAINMYIKSSESNFTSANIGIRIREKVEKGVKKHEKEANKVMQVSLV